MEMRVKLYMLAVSLICAGLAVADLRVEQPKRIAVDSGVHRLVKPQIAGRGKSNLIIEGDDGAVLSGGELLPPFSVGADGIWRTHVPRGLHFDQLFVNGRLAVRAREPNTGFLYIEQQVDAKEDLRHEAFVCPIPGVTTNSYVRIWQLWVQGFHRVSSVDSVSGAIRISPKTVRPIFPVGFGALPYVVENFREALDSPGEWFHDETEDQLLYIPMPGEKPESTHAEVPRFTCLVQLDGCRDVTFRKITFSTCGIDLANGMAGVQAQPIAEAAIRLKNATNVVFEACRFENLAGTAVRVGDGCQNVVFRDCLVQDFGVGGIYVGSCENRENAPSDILVDNCLIRRGGRVFANGIGVWVGFARNVSVMHNEIYDLFYSGISSGWTWGYAPTTVRNIRINDNYIHDIGQYALSDMGGIYTLGNHHGSEVIGNRIHDVWSNETSGSGGWGLYADEGSSNIRFESNLVYRTRTGSIHQHFGRNVVWRNNVFAYAAESPILHTRVEPHHSFDFVNNVVVWTNEIKGVRLARPVAGGPASNVVDVAFDRNVYWKPNGGVGNSFHGMSFADWQRLGMDPNGVVADPLLEDPVSGKWMPKKGSVAYALGFCPFDPMSAGLCTNRRAAWTGEPRTAPRSAVQPPMPPKWGFRGNFFFDFEGYPDEHLPPQFVESFRRGPSGRGALRLTDREALSGTHSIELRDAADLGAAYQPHFMASFTLRENSVAFGFAMKTDGKGDVSFLLRDNTVRGCPFVDGPVVTVRGTVVRSGDLVLANVLPDKWFKVSLHLMTGHPRVGYSVSVDRLDGTEPVSIDCQLAADSLFVRPTWCGFTSDARTDTVTYIDDFSMTCPIPLQ